MTEREREREAVGEGRVGGDIERKFTYYCAERGENLKF